MKSERQARIKETEAAGEREAKMLKAEADLKANEILAQAEAQAKVLRGEAEAHRQNSLRVRKTRIGKFSI